MNKNNKITLAIICIIYSLSSFAAGQVLEQNVDVQTNWRLLNGNEIICQGVGIEISCDTPLYLRAGVVNEIINIQGQSEVRMTIHNNAESVELISQSYHLEVESTYERPINIKKDPKMILAMDGYILNSVNDVIVSLSGFVNGKFVGTINNDTNIMGWNTYSNYKEISLDKTKISTLSADYYLGTCCQGDIIAGYAVVSVKEVHTEATIPEFPLGIMIPIATAFGMVMLLARRREN